MHLATQILSVALGLGMLASGALKFFPTERITRLMAAVGVVGWPLRVLGALQVASTVGLVAGLWVPALGIAAAAGLVLYFAGAIGAHVRASDPEWQGAATFLVLSTVVLVLLVVDL